jgi:lipoprotein-releasing system ATP-binding protein
MSNVQRPETERDLSKLPEAAREFRQPDVGHWTLDVGLNVVDLRKGFAAPTGQRIEVLRGVTLSVREGESVAITGASGSGKSTLLHLLGGLDVPDHGTVVLEGIDVGKLDGSRLAGFRQRKIGFVFQFHYLLPDLSALENVALPLLIARVKSGGAQRRATQLLTEVGLAKRGDHPVSHLSGGEQQRVALARALIGQPRLLLADEPTGNLDSVISEEIGKTLVNYARSQRGMTVIATHNESLARLCDRVLILEAGRLRLRV